MGALGILLGGFLINRLHMNITQILRFQLLLSLVIFPMVAIFAIPCGSVGDDVGWAGMTIPYDNRSTSGLTLTAACNADCGCSKLLLHFSPVCESNRVTYFSPCFAGCSNESVSRKF